jgi:conserved oligomeric Golgi complex subunit 1
LRIFSWIFRHNHIPTMNIDQLFEQRSIADIDQVHKKLENEIEEKKVAIRTLVGERYRDLLKAAETIGEMKTTAAKVIVHVDRITDLCTKIHEQQLLGFKAEAPPRPTTINASLHNIAIQIKILTSLPELIWTNLDRENYLVATQLFILSRHISTGLQLDSNSELMQKFPVVKKQWAFILSPFYFTIKNSCVATMEREELSAEEAARCLASLMLLENCDVDKLLTMFVQMRCKAYANILSEDTGGGAGKYEKVRDKLLASVKVLIQTVELLHEVFVNDGTEAGRLIGLIEGLADPKSKPTISLLENEDAVVLKSLPDIITKYR